MDKKLNRRDFLRAAAAVTVGAIAAVHAPAPTVQAEEVEGFVELTEPWAEIEPGESVSVFEALVVSKEQYEKLEQDLRLFSMYIDRLKEENNGLRGKVRQLHKSEEAMREIFWTDGYDHIQELKEENAQLRAQLEELLCPIGVDEQVPEWIQDIPPNKLNHMLYAHMDGKWRPIGFVKNYCVLNPPGDTAHPKTVELTREMLTGVSNPDGSGLIDTQTEFGPQLVGDLRTDPVWEAMASKVNCQLLNQCSGACDKCPVYNTSGFL